MARVDKYLVSMVRFGASGLILTSGSNITLRFPTGKRYANQATSHSDLVQLLEEIAPSAASAASRGKEGVFEYDYEGVCYAGRVEVAGDKWRVSLDMPEVSATRATGGEQTPDDDKRAESPPERKDQAVLRNEERPVQGARSGNIEPSRGGNIERLLMQMVQLGASDLHLSSGCRPMLRLHGEMQAIPNHAPYEAERLLRDLFEITPEKNRREFEERNDTDFAHAVPTISRFRANLFRDRNGPGAVFRTIPFKILSPEQLGLPKKLLELCFLTKGLVLVTGPTGSGKSTTLATLIDYINQNRSDHIITIEDPIEFVHENKKCLVNQREVHSHTRSFKDALRAALREDPDIVLVGEMRDLETISIAVETAETGHLVFGTLHTSTAPSTVDRIIDQFPADRQDQIRQMLAESLRGVVSQTLCKKKGGGRIAAYEILLGNNAVTNIIREAKTFQLFSIMQTNRAHGMITLNDSLFDLVKRGLVEPKEAYMKAVAKAEFKNQLAKEGITVSLEEPG